MPNLTPTKKLTVEEIKEILQKQDTLVCYYKPIIAPGFSPIEFKLENGELMQYHEPYDVWISAKLTLRTFEVFNLKPEFYV